MNAAAQPELSQASFKPLARESRSGAQADGRGSVFEDELNRCCDRGESSDHSGAAKKGEPGTVRQEGQKESPGGEGQATKKSVEDGQKATSSVRPEESGKRDEDEGGTKRAVQEEMSAQTAAFPFPLSALTAITGASAPASAEGGAATSANGTNGGVSGQASGQQPQALLAQPVSGRVAGHTPNGGSEKGAEAGLKQAGLVADRAKAVARPGSVTTEGGLKTSAPVTAVTAVTAGATTGEARGLGGSAPANSAEAAAQTGQVGSGRIKAAKNAEPAAASLKQGAAAGIRSENLGQQARAAVEAGPTQNRDAAPAGFRAATTSAQSGGEGRDRASSEPLPAQVGGRSAAKNGDAAAAGNRQTTPGDARVTAGAAQSGGESRARVVTESSGQSASATEAPRPAASNVPTDRAVVQAASQSAQAQSAVSGQKAVTFNAVSGDGELQRTVPSMGQGSSSGGSEGDHRGRGEGNPSSSTLLNSSSGKLDAAAAQKAENIRVFISRLDSAVQVMRQENNSTIQLRVSMERGEVIKIRLNLRGSTLKTTIHVESDSIRQQLRSSWDEVSQALAEKGVAAENPDFDQGSDASSGQQENFEDQVAAASSRSDSNGQSGPVSDGSSEAPSAAAGSTESRFFSRIA